MSSFKAGYASVNINPPLGIGIYGYYVPRFAKGFLDDLEAAALTLSLGEKDVVLLSVDHGGIDRDILEKYCEDIEKATGIKKENIFIMQSGDVLAIDQNEAKIIDKVQTGAILVDGLGVGDVGNIVLRDRQHLAEDGIMIVVLTLEKGSNQK